MREGQVAKRVTRHTSREKKNRAAILQPIYKDLQGALFFPGPVVRSNAPARRSSTKHQTQERQDLAPILGKSIRA